MILKKDKIRQKAAGLRMPGPGDRECIGCSHFEGRGECHIVEGTISFDMTCDLYKGR